MNFDSFYTELISDQRWFELLRMYRDVTIKAAAQKVYAGLVADGTVEARPMQENRKHVYNILCKNPGDKVSKPWYVLEQEEKARIEYEQQEDKSWVPITGEERQKRLKEWEAIVKGSTMLNSMPKPSYKTLAEEGGVLPAKPAPYPITTPEEAYVRDRRFAWIKNSFEPRTAQRLPDSLEEHEFNLQYDFENYDDHVKKFSEWYKENKAYGN